MTIELIIFPMMAALLVVLAVRTASLVVKVAIHLALIAGLGFAFHQMGGVDAMTQMSAVPFDLHSLLESARSFIGA